MTHPQDGWAFAELEASSELEQLLGALRAFKRRAPEQRPALGTLKDIAVTGRQLRELLAHPEPSSDPVPAARRLFHTLTARLDGIARAAPQQTLAPADLTRRQLELMNCYLEFVKVHSPYWRVRLPDLPLRDSREILDLPLCSKADVLEHHTFPLMDQLQQGRAASEVRSPMMTVPLSGCEIWRTSSSTGLPTVLVRLPEELDLFADVTARYLRRWFGPDDVIANLDHPAGGWPGVLFGRLIPNVLGCACEFLGNAESDEYLLNEFERFRFNSVIGTPSWFAQFLTRLDRCGRLGSLPRIAKFCYGGEPADAFVQSAYGVVSLPDFLEARYGTLLLSVYSGTELGVVGVPLTEGQRTGVQFTTADDGGLVEFLADSGEPITCAADGQAVVTAFCNFAVPLVRFASGDAIRLLSETCEDGRGGRVFCFSPTGARLDDTITTASGKLYGAGVIAQRLTEALQTPCQLVISQGPDSGELLVTVRTERVVEAELTRNVERLVREEFFRLEPSARNKPVADGLSVILATGLIVTTTGKFRTIIQTKH